MAGHSHWAGIKHKKGKADKIRSKIFSKLSREITVAAKLGDKDPDINPRLRSAIQSARSANMPKDNIIRAIQKSEQIQSTNYENIRYEGFGPHRVACIVETLTDNKNRTVAELRNIFSKFGGSLGESGSVAWMFEKKGQIILNGNSLEFDSLFDIALEAGAEDIAENNESFVISTHFESLYQVKKILEDEGCIIKSADYELVPKTPIKIKKEESEVFLNFLYSLEGNDDVNKIFSNLVIE